MENYKHKYPVRQNKIQQKEEEKTKFGQETRQPKPRVKQMGFERSSCLPLNA
jgi:hypothetical protein